MPAIAPLNRLFLPAPIAPTRVEGGREGGRDRGRDGGRGGKNNQHNYATSALFENVVITFSLPESYHRIACFVAPNWRGVRVCNTGMFSGLPACQYLFLIFLARSVTTQ